MMQMKGNTNIRLLLLILTMTVWCRQHVHAQTDIIFTQYWEMPTLLNPAATGDTDFIRIRGGARLQWVGIENAPKTFVATGDMPFNLMKKRIGAGLTVSQESIGLFSNLLISAQGSYKFNILKGRLSIGIQAGYYNSRFRGSDVYIPDNDDYHQPNDPSIPTQDLSGNAFDLSAGVSYSNKNFYIGVSGMHLTSPMVSLSQEGSNNNEQQQYQTELPRSLYFDAGCNIEIPNTLFTLQPSLIAGSDFTDFAGAVTVRGIYNKFLSVGLGYRWRDAFSIMIGAEFKNFFLGYAFDMPTSALARASAGSHELVAGYRLKLDLSGKNKNKHRSIRIM